jgi:cold shock CspA family protein
MCQGIITYISGKGWFFAENTDDHSSIFIHQKDVENRRYLKIDDRISFDVTPSRTQPGEFQAINVKYLGHNIARQTSGSGAVGRA